MPDLQYPPLRSFWASLPPQAACSDWADARAHPLASDAARRLCRGFAATRRTDFINGRACARQALQGFGIDVPALPRGNHREPLWPPGFSGSITHTQGYCAAVAAPRTSVQAIGIDAECRGALSERLIRRSCSAAELQTLQEMPAAQRAAHAIVLLSAKESLFKCLFPLHGPIGLRDADIVAAADGSLHVGALRGGMPATLPALLRGRHARVGALTLSYFTITAAAVSSAGPILNLKRASP